MIAEKFLLLLPPKTLKFINQLLMAILKSIVVLVASKKYTKEDKRLSASQRAQMRNF